MTNDDEVLSDYFVVSIVMMKSIIWGFILPDGGDNRVFSNYNAHDLEDA